MRVHVAMPVAQRAALAPYESFPSSLKHSQHATGPHVAGMAYQWFRDMYSKIGLWNNRAGRSKILGVAIKLR